MAEYTVELKRSAEKELAKLPDDIPLMPQKRVMNGAPMIGPPADGQVAA